jgi:ribosomal protein S18 acetylase RimI-like enzyme
LRIRTVKTTDIREIIKIQLEEEMNCLLTRKNLGLAIKNKNALILVAEEKSDILGFTVGYISPTNSDEGFIHLTMVKKEYREKGIGKRLVHKICLLMFRKKVKIIYAIVEKRTISFYNECEFKFSRNWIEMSKKKREKKGKN